MNIKFIRGNYNKRSSSLQSAVNAICIIGLIVSTVFAVIYDQLFVILIATAGSLLLMILTQQVISYLTQNDSDFTWILEDDNTLKEIVGAPLKFDGIILVKQQGDAFYFDNIESVPEQGICIHLHYNFMPKKHKSDTIYIPDMFDIELYKNTKMYRKFAHDYYEDIYYQDQDTEIIEDINEFIRISLEDVFSKI